MKNQEPEMQKYYTDRLQETPSFVTTSHPYAIYLASEADAKIAALEQQLAVIREYYGVESIDALLRQKSSL